MKIVASLVLIFLVALALCGSAGAYTWEGKLDPKDFDKWKMVSVGRHEYQGCVWVVVENPNAEATIRKVNLEVCQKMLIGYTYFEFGKLHVFRYDIKGDRYIEIKFTRKQERRCFGCHLKPGFQVSVGEVGDWVEGGI